MMLFFILGMQNAWRNLARSTVAVVAMSLAVGFLTYAMSLDRGYAGPYHGGMRALMGGEISVYAETFGTYGADPEERLHLRELRESPQTDLAIYEPEVLKPGYLGPRGAIIRLDAGFQEALAGAPAVQAVYPHYRLPSWHHTRTGAVREVSLRGRDLALDASMARPPERFIADGRWLNEDDADHLVGVVTRTPDSDKNAPYVGEIWRLSLPHFLGYMADGRPQFDYDNRLELEIEIVGLLELPSRVIAWRPDGRADGSSDGSDIVETLYWQSAELHLPLATWQRIWAQMSGEPYQPQQLGLLVPDTAYLKDHLSTLRQRFPQATFVSTVDQLERSMRTLRLETQPQNAPQSAYYRGEAEAPYRQHDEISLSIHIVLIFIAALVIASQLLLMVQYRRKEIAIMKTLGTKRSQLVVMTLGEVLLIANLGALLGFGTIRVQAAINQLTAATGLLQVVLHTGRDMLLMLVLTSLVSLLFGLFPSLKLADIPVMEVIRDE